MSIYVCSFITYLGGLLVNIGVAMKSNLQLMRCSLVIQLFCWNIFHTFLKIKIKTLGLLAWLIEHCLKKSETGTYKNFFPQCKTNLKSFPIRIDCWKKCSMQWFWGRRWRVSLRNWQDYNFNQKTSSTWPKFSIGYSPHAVPLQSPQKSLMKQNMLFPVATP